MCGRFVRTSPAEAIRRAFETAGGDDITLVPRYNVCPDQDVVAVIEHEGGRRMAILRWGLVPSFARSPSSGPRAINARAETVAERPAFRSALRRRRCLVVADGFYEWRREPGGRKTPFLFRLATPGPFAFAGLWERWEAPGAPPLLTCAIVTTAANALVAPVHDRMPAILPTAAYAPWLDPGCTDPAAVLPLLAPIPAAAMCGHAVSPRVNAPRNDDPACIVPVGSA